MFKSAKLLWDDNKVYQTTKLSQIKLCSSRKYPYSPPQKGLEFPGGVGGSVRPKNLKKCMKLK